MLVSMMGIHHHESNCGWPFLPCIDRSFLPSQPPAPAMSIGSAISASAAGAVLDTLVEKAQQNDDDELKGMVYELIDFIAEKVTKYRDNAPHAETLNKLLGMEK